MKNDIIIISTCDWSGLWYQRQHLACQFALHGHKIYYFNRTLQRWPTINHLLIRLSYIKSEIEDIYVPDNIKIITPIAGPPLKMIRFLNKRLLKNSIKCYKFKEPIIVSYLPTYNALDLIDLINPIMVAYINEHNYDAMKIIPGLIDSERELIKTANVICADSKFNRERLKKISDGKMVYPSLPGVYYNEFKQAYRGNEIYRKKNIYYFGLIENYLNLNLYIELSIYFEIVFIGRIAPGMRKKIPPSIKVRPPVFNRDLPHQLREADIIGLFYVNSPYIRGVIPAKLFECIATKKPILVSGLEEAKPYSDILYDVQGSLNMAYDIINSLQISETNQKLQKKDLIAKEADWKNRYDYLHRILKLNYPLKHKDS